jgi:hypothetical protein
VLLPYLHGRHCGLCGYGRVLLVLLFSHLLGDLTGCPAST